MTVSHFRLVKIILPLKTVENCTSETEGLFIIDHGHEEKNDGRSGRDGGSRHGQKLLLVLVTTSDNLGQGVDGLSEDVCRNATGQ